MKRKSSKDMTKASEEWIAKADVAKTACADAKSKFISLQEESKNFMDTLLKEKHAKAELTTLVRKAKKENVYSESSGSENVETDDADSDWWSKS